MDIDLHTSRLHIRKLQMADFQAYYDLVSHPEIQQGAGFGLMSNPAMIEELLKRQIKAPGSLAIELNGKLIGAILLLAKVGFDGLPDPNQIEVSYFLAPHFWHQGIMTEACLTVINDLKYRRKIHKITAEVFANNVNSIALLKRLDFIPVTKLIDPIVGKPKIVFEYQLE
ncbi:GNAT family N-acetyltransferase [Lentilactobacillus diolivorans]|uniref:GNAT family N-acetyltransferase n=1 Tax=Lentilactobacillus diolivorans TaxID=179838 RepID=UPI00246883BA|nr:GNAT family N-acetyltransferase [Lentilactobacillus diolivorans]MDH5105450.1 GNAT family N-acetyltransferase [Lentilactobacillus diolivorans]